MSWIDDSSEGSAELHPDYLYVDEEGDWYYRGNRIIRDDIIELFLDNLHMTPGGGFLVEWGQSRCPLKAGDTPFVVARVDRVRRSNSDAEQILLRFRHISKEETLDASTLYVGKGNVLYCRIRGGLFPARFSRPAYYQLAEWIQEDSATGGFFIELNGDSFFIRGHQAD